MVQLQHSPALGMFRNMREMVKDPLRGCSVARECEPSAAIGNRPLTNSGEMSAIKAAKIPPMAAEPSGASKMRTK